MSDVAEVRSQYERFPYPPVPALALPARGQGERLRWETGVAAARAARLGDGLVPVHDGLRILVAGAGTLEAVVVADAHPRAREVVAVDLSEASMRTLRRRVAWARVSNALRLGPLLGRRLPPVRAVCADLHAWSGGAFDYVLADNMLQHVPDGAALLGRLASWLAPAGLLRVVTYPQMGRFWIRWTRRWLELRGVRAGMSRLRASAAAAIGELPSPHPLRSCWDGHLETGTDAGLVDGFLHALERPLGPLAWAQAAHRAGLALVAEAQVQECRGAFLTELAPGAAPLGPWERQQVLDDLLEMSVNPIWWFRRAPRAGAAPGVAPDSSPPAPEDDELGESTPPERVAARPDGPWWLPSAPYAELGAALRRARTLLGRAGVALEDVVDTLRREVGPHIHARTGRELPLLTIGEHDPAAILATPAPWGEDAWAALAERVGPGVALHLGGGAVPGASLADQAAWLQCVHGAVRPRVGPLTLRPSGGVP